MRFPPKRRHTPRSPANPAVAGAVADTDHWTGPPVRGPPAGLLACASLPLLRARTPPAGLSAPGRQAFLPTAARGCCAGLTLTGGAHCRLGPRGSG
jgi:hypothetical protein